MVCGVWCAVCGVRCAMYVTKRVEEGGADRERVRSGGSGLKEVCGRDGVGATLNSSSVS